jgi:hypothetical protein
VGGALADIVASSDGRVSLLEWSKDRSLKI